MTTDKPAIVQPDRTLERVGSCLENKACYFIAWGSRPLSSAKTINNKKYQTYCPNRQFRIENYNFVLDRRFKEKQILNHPNIFKEKGEWIKKENSRNIFLELTRV
jgi:hypothetical protein